MAGLLIMLEFALFLLIFYPVSADAVTGGADISITDERGADLRSSATTLSY
jgi:hypothetical protein